MKKIASVMVFLMLLEILFCSCAASKREPEDFPENAVPQTEELGEKAIPEVPEPPESFEAPGTESEETAAAESGVFTRENYPRVDGSTVTIPLSEAIYARLTGCSDIQARLDILHNTTHYAYVNLIKGNCDIIFVTGPSEDELEMAHEEGVELEVIPIVSEAFVFLVSKDNPVEGLTHQQIVDIYSGKIRNWKEVGGDDVAIKACQRPDNSGSQTGIIGLVMGDTELAEAPTELKPAAMGGLIDMVSVYDSKPDAIGYSYYYYVNDMWGYNETRLLAVDGVLPNNDTVADGSYRYRTSYYAVINKNEPEDSGARKLVDWILSDEGQQLAEDTGYVRLERSENAVSSESSQKISAVGTSTEPCGALYYGHTNPIELILNEEDGREKYGGSKYHLEYSACYTVSGLKDAFAEARVNERIMEIYSEAIQWNVPPYRGSGDIDPLAIKTGIKDFSMCITFNYNDFLSLYGYTELNYGSLFSDIAPVTFDLRTGKELKLADLFAEGFPYEKIINDKIVRRFDDPSEIFNAELTSPFGGIREDQKFYLTDHGIVIVLDYLNTELDYSIDFAYPDGIFIDYDVFGDSLVLSRDCDSSIYTSSGPSALHLISSSYNDMVYEGTDLCSGENGVFYNETLSYPSTVPEKLVEQARDILKSNRIDTKPYEKTGAKAEAGEYYDNMIESSVDIGRQGKYYVMHYSLWAPYGISEWYDYYYDYVYDSDGELVKTDDIFGDGFDWVAFLAAKFKENTEKYMLSRRCSLAGDSTDYAKLAENCYFSPRNDHVRFSSSSPVMLYSSDGEGCYEYFPSFFLKLDSEEAAELRLEY